MVKDRICKLLRDKFWLTYQFEEQSLLLCLSNSLQWFWIHIFWMKNKLYRQLCTMKWKLRDQIQNNNIAHNKIVSLVTSMSGIIIRKDYCKPQLLWPGWGWGWEVGGGGGLCSAFWLNLFLGTDSMSKGGSFQVDALHMFYWRCFKVLFGMAAMPIVVQTISFGHRPNH